MNIMWLEDFLALAQTRNFSRAAALRHSSQPALNRRIRALEDWLGTPLFDRSSQPLALTHSGQWLCGEAERLVQQLAQLPDKARQAAAQQRLQLACTHTLSQHFLPAWLARLEARISLSHIQLISDMQPHCEQLFQQGRIPFMLSHAHRDVPSALDSLAEAACVVGHDRLLPVAAADEQGRPRHRLAMQASLLDYSGESGLGRILRGVLGRRSRSLRLETVFTAHLAAVLRDMVLAGRGLAWLPQSLIRHELEAGTLLAAADEDWQLEVDIVLYRAHASPPSGGFWQAALAEAATGM